MPLYNQIVSPSLVSKIAEGRLTLISNTPVLTSNVTGATTIYYTPYIGNQISIYSGSQWIIRTFTELSLSLVGLTANSNYDIFIYDNNGALALESVAWSNSGAGTSTRASGLTYLDGVRIKTSDNRKYLGTVRINNTNGQTDFLFDNPTGQVSIFLVNEYNKQSYSILKNNDVQHLYATGVYRQYNNELIDRIEMIYEGSYLISLYSNISKGFVGLGLNSITVYKYISNKNNTAVNLNQQLVLSSKSSGFDYYQVLEYGLVDGTFSQYCICLTLQL